MSHWKTILLKSGLLFLILHVFAGARAQLPKIVFTPQWTPQAQFAGYYVALEKGFYKDAGIDVEIVHLSANIQPTASLASGKADLVSLSLVTAISARNQGLELINTGQLSQHSAILFVTKKTSGINDFSQLNGKKIGIWKSGFDEVPKALMAERKLQIEWIPILSTVNLFMMNGIDALTVMSYNEYHQILNSGLNADELNTFPVADYGYDIPEDGLYCLKSAFGTKRQEVEKFLEATLKGWEFAAANKGFALEITLKRMKEAHLPASRAHQEWMLNKTLELQAPGTKSVARGELLEADFRQVAGILNKHNQTDMKYSFTDFYRPQLK